MSTPVWGMLEKAQDDDQTIDEAIAAKIAEHNADEEAHQAAGESLNLHKSDEVIDHPAGSVVGDKYENESISPDKLKFAFLIYSADEPGLSQDISSGNHIYSYLYRSEFYIQSLADENLCSIYTNFGELPSDWSEEDIFFEVVAKSEGSSGDAVKWGIGMGTEDLVDYYAYSQYGFYFNCADSKIYAYYWSDEGISAVAVKEDANNIYIIYTVTIKNNTVTWYLDGVQVRQVVNPVFDVPDGAMLTIGSNYNVSGNARIFYVRSVSYSQNQKH